MIKKGGNRTIKGPAPARQSILLWVAFLINSTSLVLFVWNSIAPITQIPKITLLITVLASIGPAVLAIILWRQNNHSSHDDYVVNLTNKLSTTEGKSDIVINTIEDGVMAINGQGIIELINPSAQALIGWNKGDALGLDWRSVLKLVNIEGKEVGQMENPISLTLSSNTPTHSDTFFLLTSSDKRRLVSVVCSPVGNVGSGVIVVFRDITKERAEEREQAEFISTASHEMRTPVASIEGYLGLALNPATATIDEKARDFITKAHESARHLGRLFQDLLDISRADDGRLKNEPHVIDVSESAGTVFEGLAHLAAAKNLRYVFKPNPSLDTDSAERRLQPVFYADIDPSHFREVMSNLIENAIKYTLEGDITVDVKGSDKTVTVSVTDSGVGIPAEDIPHLFQKFYRVDNSDTREIGGTGLGLYLCRRLAETMGGHLSVESEYKKGSTFFLTIPRISHEEAMRKLNELPETATQITLDERPVLPQENLQAQDAMAMDFDPAPTATESTLHTPALVAEPPVEQQLPTPQPAIPETSKSPHQTTIPTAPQPTPYYTPVIPGSYTHMTLSDLETAVASQSEPVPQQLPPSTTQQSAINQQSARVESVAVPPRPRQ